MTDQPTLDPIAALREHLNALRARGRQIIKARAQGALDLGAIDLAIIRTEASIAALEALDATPPGETPA